MSFTPSREAPNSSARGPSIRRNPGVHVRGDEQKMYLLLYLGAALILILIRVLMTVFKLG
jgi:hypothetical protein